MVDSEKGGGSRPSGQLITFSEKTVSGQSVYLAANQNMINIYALGGLYSILPAPLMASRPSSAVISTVVWIFDNAPPAAAAISADAAVTLSGPSIIRQRWKSPNA